MTKARRAPARLRRPREPNAAWRQLRRSTRPGTAGAAEYGAAGVTFFAPPGAQVALFQLASALVYPDLAGAGSSHYTVEPTPYATARMVWCHHFDGEDKDAEGRSLRSYGGTGNSRLETIYHPGVFRNSNGYAIGHPAFRTGDRVFCALNTQSGRWEILSPPLGVWRFELKTNLEPGGTASAHLLGFTNQYEVDTHVELTVHDSLLGTCRGRGRVAPTAGTRGFAQYFPDANRWEILAVEQQARWVRFQLAGDLSYADSAAAGHVLDYWDGYDPDPHDDDITVVNCAVTGQYLFAGQTGTVGLACLDTATGSYRIVQMECP